MNDPFYKTNTYDYSDISDIITYQMDKVWSVKNSKQTIDWVNVSLRILYFFLENIWIIVEWINKMKVVQEQYKKRKYSREKKEFIFAWIVDIDVLKSNDIISNCTEFQEQVLWLYI